MKKRFIALLTATMLLVGALFTITSCNTQGGTGNNNNGNTTTGTAVSYVNLDINPEISMTLDKDDKVVSVMAENDDANVLLYGEDSLVGVDVNVAVDKIVALAVELDFLSADNTAVEAIISGKDEADSTRLLSKINAKIDEASGELSFNITLDTEGAYTLVRDYEAFVAAHPELANITVVDYKLACEASEDGSIQLEAAVKLDRDELLSKIDEKQKRCEEYFTKAYNKAAEEAKKTYDELAGAAIDAVYVEFYAANAFSHMTDYYLGAAYSMYASGARAFSAMSGVYEKAEDYRDFELDEDMIDDIMVLLELTDTDRSEITDENGKITLGSIYSYVDIYMKNIEDEATHEEKRDLIDDVLGNAEEAFESAGLIELAKGVASSIKSLKGALDALGGGILVNTDAYKATFAKYDEAIALLEAEVVTEETLDRAATLLAEGRDEVKTRIDASLTEDEKATIENMKETKKQILDGYKAAFDQALADAKTAAENYLREQKDARRAKAAE
ncbi:MAG: hypothetical protein IKA68_05525 [Clostridia bacterium]|nr:hypothetical protein [Clostridia bacterium]